MAAELLVCWIDRDHDRASASDGVSRYGAYLHDHAGLFDPWGEAPDGLTGDPVEFAVAAFRVATGPIMSPGYVRWHGRVCDYAATWSEHDGRLLLATRQRPTVMAARSILYRILQAAEDERVIFANPVRKVPAPKPEVDPDQVFGEAGRRALTPEEAGQLLARFPVAWWDHIVGLLGTGLRFGEFAGLRRNRVHLARDIPVLQVAPIRYQAGRFGSGFKSRPKSPAGIRPVPLAPQVVEAIRRQLPAGSDPSDLVFTVPVPGPDRVPLSRHLVKHVYQKAAVRLTDPTRDLPSTVRRVLHTLRADGPLALDQLTERFSAPGGKLRRRTIQAALDTLTAEGLALQVIHGDGPPCWSAAELDQPRRFADLDLHGPHDLRHTFATWLEDAAIPSRVIDEVMGHAGGRHPEHGSRMGRVYRETTPEMVTRVVAAIETRLAVVLDVAMSGGASCADRFGSAWWPADARQSALSTPSS